MNFGRLLFRLVQSVNNTKLPYDRIQKLQEKKLRRLLKYAYEHSAYYKRVFKENGIHKDNLASMPLSAFPTLDKETLMEHFDELATAPELRQECLQQFDKSASMEEKKYLGKYHIVHSSGSTGTPRYFVYDEKAWEQMLVGIVRGALWGMSLPQMLKLILQKPKILYIAATDGRYGGAMAVGDGIDGVGAFQMFLDINTPLTEWVRRIREFQPNIIIGYPSAVKILGELVEKKEVELQVVRVISCGEPLSHGMRHYMEKTFRCSVANFYGASETLAMGVELDEKEGMYLFDDLNLIEVVDGEMYVTVLYNDSQPLIRYHISDKLSLKELGQEGKNICAFSKAEAVFGRNEDVLWFEEPDGRREFLHPLAVEGFCVEGLLDYQFRQTDKDTFEMLAETTPEADREKVRSELLKQVKQVLIDKQLFHINFFMRFVEKIEANPETGKKQLIIKLEEREYETVSREQAV